jgi:5'-3' exonuclease
MDRPTTEEKVPTLGLLDGDIFAYQAAASVEVETCWDDENDLWTLHSSFQEGRHALDTMLEEIKDFLKLDGFRIALSDSTNWRMGVMPTYKSNRKKVRKPIILKALKDYLRETYGAQSFPTLEGDDLLGIWATQKRPMETVIVTTDKDLHTIPGQVCRYLGAEPEIVTISPRLADYWHLYQTLTGDTTDGYPGCPGIGPKKAEPLLARMLETEEAEFPVAKIWTDIIVPAYKKAGLSEEVALQNARVARILRHGEYDHDKREVKLWLPSQ